MTEERNKERKQAVFKLLKHQDLGIMLGLAIVFLGLSVWSYLFIVLFLFCFMEWHDENGYKFLACNGTVDSNSYSERDVVNVMAYKMDNAFTGAILLIITLPLTYFIYSLPVAIYVLIMTLLWYFSGVKEVFYYNPFDKGFLENKNIWWYSFTFYGFLQYTIRKKTMSGRDTVIQAFTGILVSIIFTIIWTLTKFNFIKELL